MKTAKDFLLKNGFECKNNRYANDRCCVVITYNYSVMDNNFNSTYSDNLNIYWLIGYLTYYNLMDKDYKK